MSNGSPVVNGKYELCRLIGRGNFSKVYLALDLKSGRNVAIKVVGKEKVVREGMTEQVKREITVMKMVKHPNVVELYEVMATKSNIYFVMELVRGGELFSKIAVNGRMREDVARSYFRQLISVLDFCHSRGVYHRDLKPENLLLDENGNLKIADFGFSAFADDHLHSDGLLHTRCGTPAYVAPEVILKRGYDGAKADLWSCGVILFVLLAGKLPFHDDNLVAMCKKIFKSDFKCPNWFSSDARRLITKLLDPNPNTRITIAKIQHNPWFTRPIPIIPNIKPLTARIEETPSPEKKPETMNAFHIISLSEGFDLSPLFEEKKRYWGEEKMWFVTRESVKGVISRLEDLAAKTGGGMSLVTNCENRVRLESVESGRRGKLAVVAEMFLVGKEVLVVEVKRDSGDPLEYVRFFSDHLRPALKDIIWASSGSHQETMTTGTSL